jgi:hypothetical protein
MHGELTYEDVAAACQDLQSRSLSRIPCDFAKLVYLASTRDYNSGEYYHEGLARQFTERVARKALAVCHREVFRSLVLCSVEQLVEQLAVYVQSTRLPLSDVVRTWDKLQPYQVLIPSECSLFTSHFFGSNVRAALAILQSRHCLSPLDLRSASPRP